MLEVLVRLSATIQTRLATSAAQHDLSVTQLRLLGILRDRELTINELATHLNLDKSSTSGLVNRAARRGLISRTRDEHDRRSIRVRLEPTGRSLIDAATRQVDTDLHEVLTTLTEDERARWTALTTRLLTTEAGEQEITLSNACAD